MKKICRSFLLLSIGIVILTVSHTAEAAFTTESITLGQTSTDFTRSLALSSFDSTLGTLTSIAISYTDSGVMNGFVQNTSASTQNFNVSEDSFVKLLFGGTTLLSNHLIATQSYTQLGSSQSSNFGIATPSGSASASMVSSGTLFDAFSQPSSTVFLTLNTLTSTTVIGGGGNVNTGIYTTVGATVTVTFGYTPFTVVPEPSSMALVTIGGIALATTRLRKRRSR